MDNVIYNESGTLLPDVFYEFRVPFSTMDVTDPKHKEPTDDWIYSLRVPEGYPGDWMWVRVSLEKNDWIVERSCPLANDHVREFKLKSAAVDIFGGERLSPFIPDVDYDQIVVTNAFRMQLEQCGLKGLKSIPLTVVAPEERNATLFLVESTAKYCLRPFKVQGVANACPFCGYAPVVCAECGYFMRECLDCKRETCVGKIKHEGPADRRLKVNAIPTNGIQVLLGSMWDGSDFINVGWYFITKRMVNWLQAVHAFPFIAKPARICIDGMSEEQLAWLKRAQEPLPTLEEK